MAEGTVRWFSIEKGFGFIERLKGKDILVLRSALQGKGLTSLSEGDEVQFDTVQGPKGLQAANVRRLEFLMPHGLNAGRGTA